MVQDNQLISKSELKEYLNFDPAELTLDNFFDQIINACSDILEVYCNTKLKKCTVTEIVSGEDPYRLYLSNSHILSVLEIKYWGSSVFRRLYNEDEIRVNLVPSGHSIYNRAGDFTEGSYNYEVSYICGFDPIPDDLKLVCLELCAVLFNNSSLGDSRIGLISNQSGNFKMFFLDELPRHEHIINKYRLICI
ncbi:MAG: hypothetical protein ACM34K_06560 [Bacillota bacterium]